MKDIIIAGLDLETTGLLSPDHRIVEVYIGLWRNGKRIFAFDQRVDPQRAIAVDAQRVHGISNTDLFGKPTWDKVAPSVAKVLAKAHMTVAHNGEEFDWLFLKQEMEREKLKLPDIPMVDTMLDGIWATADGKKPRLEELCFACDEPYDQSLAHAASYDVERMMACFHKAVEWGFIDLPDLVAAKQHAA